MRGASAGERQEYAITAWRPMKYLTLALWSWWAAALCRLFATVSLERRSQHLLPMVWTSGLWPTTKKARFVLHRPGIAVWANDFFKRTVLEDGGTVFVQQHGMKESLASHSCSEIYYVPVPGKVHSGRQAYIKVYVDGSFASGSAVTWMQMYCHECHCYRSAF